MGWIGSAKDCSIAQQMSPLIASKPQQREEQSLLPYTTIAKANDDMLKASWEEAPRRLVGWVGSARVWKSKVGAWGTEGESGSGLKGISNTREWSLLCNPA